MNRWFKTVVTFGVGAVLFGVVAGAPAFARDDDHGYRDSGRYRGHEAREHSDWNRGRDRDHDRDYWRGRHEEELARERRERFERERRRHEREERYERERRHEHRDW